MALAAIVGYYILPLLAGATARTLADIATLGVDTLISKPVSYHVLVLAIPSLLVTVGAILLSRRRGAYGRTDDFKVIGGVVVTPLVSAVVLYLIGALVVAGSFAGYIGLPSFREVPSSLDTLESLLYVLLSILGMLMWLFLVLVLSLAIGGYGLVSHVFPVFIPAIGAGAVSGYLLVRLMTTVVQRYERDVQG